MIEERALLPASTAPRLSTGIAALDALLDGGIPRGHLVEISGPPSSGKTSLALALIAEAQRRGDPVAFLDPTRAFYAPGAAAAGVDLERLLLVRPPGVEEGLRALDHLLRSKGFPLLVLDLGLLRARPALDRLFRVARLAKTGEVVAVLLTEAAPEDPSLGSPVALRLAVRRQGFLFQPARTPPFVLAGSELRVELRKSKFGPPHGAVTIPLAANGGSPT